VAIGDAVRRASEGTVTYSDGEPLPESGPGAHDTAVEVVNETTLSATRNLIDDGFRPAALNFASAPPPRPAPRTGRRGVRASRPGRGEPPHEEPDHEVSAR